MTSKSVFIQIAQPDFTALKADGYQLCYARQVNGIYTAVWQATPQYLTTNQFSWMPLFQLFGISIVQLGVTVQPSTNTMDIAPGETSILSENGLIGDPAAGGPDQAVTLENQYGAIHPGLNGLTTNINGEEIATPIYIAPTAAVIGPTVLTPAEKVLVWFEQNVQTGTMLGSGPPGNGNTVEIDLTYANNATRLYESGHWVVP